MIKLLDGSGSLIGSISSRAVFETAGWRIVKKSVIEYLENRIVLDCIAVKVLDHKN